MAWLSKKQLEQNSVEAAQAAMALADLQEQVSAAVEALRHVIVAVYSLNGRLVSVEARQASTHQKASKALLGVDVLSELLDGELQSEGEESMSSGE